MEKKVDLVSARVPLLVQWKQPISFADDSFRNGIFSVKGKHNIR